MYSNVKSHVLLMEPAPPISKIFSLVAQQERQLSSNALIANIKNVQPMVKKSNVQSSVVCSFCGKNGHNDSVCFKKHGFPNQNEKKVSHNGNRKVCTHCNRTYHTVDTCYKKHGYPPGYKF